MADLIKKVKIKKQDGTFTDYIPIGAEADNVVMNNNYSVQDNIGNIDIEKDGNIVEQIQKIDNEEVLYYFNPQSNSLLNPGATTEIHGECSVIKAYGKVIMIDTGGTNRSNSVKEYLQSIGVNKVDYLIISHWHYDHCTNFYSNMDYIDWSDCVCYFPLEIPSWSLKDRSYYNECVSYANQHCKQIIFPVDWDELILNNFFKITFYNCGEQAFNEIKEIEDEIEEYAGHGGGYASQYYFNDYGLLALVQHNGNRVLYSGDAMKANQERAYLANFAANVDLYKMHHHGVNSIGDNKNSVVNIQYCIKINPKNVVVMNNIGGDENYFSSNDVSFFNNSNIYCPGREKIIFATKQGHCYQKTNAIKIQPRPTAWIRLYFFIDYNNYQNENIDFYVQDGSYKRPFYKESAALAYPNFTNAKNCFDITYVYMPFNSSNHAGSINNTLTESRYITLMSYDWYKNGSSAYPMTNYGEFTQEAIDTFNKYKYRAPLTSSKESAYLTVYGIKFAPTDDTLNYHTVFKKNDTYYQILSIFGHALIDHCIISYEDVTKNDSIFYWGAWIHNFSVAKFNCCYFYDCILGIGAGASSTSYINTCSGDNILKFAGQDGGTIVYERYGFGKTLRNVHLGKPSWTSISDQVCWNIFSPVVFSADTAGTGPTSIETCYDENDNRITFEEWLRQVNKYPWNYRNLVPQLVEHRHWLDGYPALGNLSSASGEETYACDAYGANLREYSLGAMTTTPGYNLQVIAEEIEHDLNNLTRIGVYNIQGSGAAEAYTNCPTRYNCKIVVSQLTPNSSYTMQEVFARDGAIYRRLRDDTHSNSWSEWQTVSEPLTWTS